MRWTTTHLRILGASLAICAAAACAEGMTLGVVYADRRPPPPRVEVIAQSPGPGFVWIAGYWSWRSDDYYWTPGHWERAKHGYNRWESGHWQHRHNRWYWVEGHWAR
ncbi:MAG TPA: hypothetical protein VLV16_02315 [Gemmatimonadales bacterium]|nr:hypothetical protein [Gemmatimonadales bacterium]